MSAGQLKTITIPRFLMLVFLSAMVIMTRIKGVTEDMSSALIFIVLSLIGIAFLWTFLKALRPSKTNKQ